MRSYQIMLYYYTLEASRIQFIQNFEIKQINEMFWICSFIELKKKKRPTTLPLANQQANKRLGGKK